MSYPSNKSLTANEYPFLAGGGEMGQLIRSKNWAATSVGSIDEWPQSLRTTLSIILHSRFPMFLWWGPDLVCFYNDAYRPSLGQYGKHPSILGMIAEEAWPEIWRDIKPLIEQVLNGASTWSEDQLLPIYRNGQLENVYWTFSYSPVNDESGKPAGVFVTCFETTEKVNNLKKLEENSNEFQYAIEATELGTFDYNPVTNHFKANVRLKEWFGLEPHDEVLLDTAIAVIAAPDQLSVTTAIEEALLFSSGGLYDVAFTIVHPVTGFRRIVRAKGRTWFNENQTAYRFTGTLQDISEQEKIRQQQQENQEKLNIVIEASELGIWDLNLLTDELNVSDRYLELFGYEQGPVKSHPYFLNQLHPEDVPVRNAAFDLALVSGVLNYETRIFWPDTSLHWLQIKGNVSYNQVKQPVQILGTVRDITDEKHYQQDLEQREQKFRMLADAMPQFVWTGDANGHLNYFNEAVYNYTGLCQDQVLNGGWINIVHPDERAENTRLWTESITQGVPFNFEHRFRRHDGEYRWQLSRAIAQKNAAGQTTMWVGSSTDIQEIKKLDQDKDYFISLASHELKTPITSIKGYIQMLQKMHANGPDAFLKNSLSVVGKQISTLTNLISDLLDLSKIKTGILTLNAERFDINEQVCDVVAEINKINPGHTINVTTAARGFVDGDKERISQVLINFLTNAIKYAPGSYIINVNSTIENGHVVISVRDNGIGIQEMDQQKIFQRFYRVEGKNEKTFPGFGIGLFIASEIITRHHGKIGVSSTPGNGSTFYFSLPLVNEVDASIL